MNNIYGVILQTSTAASSARESWRYGGASSHEVISENQVGHRSIDVQVRVLVHRACLYIKVAILQAGSSREQAALSKYRKKRSIQQQQRRRQIDEQRRKRCAPRLRCISQAPLHYSDSSDSSQSPTRSSSSDSESAQKKARSKRVQRHHSDAQERAVGELAELPCALTDRMIAAPVVPYLNSQAADYRSPMERRIANRQRRAAGPPASLYERSQSYKELNHRCAGITIDRYD